MVHQDETGLTGSMVHQEERMLTGHGTGLLLAAFAVAALLVVFWRVVLAVLATTMLGLMLIGAAQVAHWIQALS